MFCRNYIFGKRQLYILICMFLYPFVSTKFITEIQENLSLIGKLHTVESLFIFVEHNIFTSKHLTVILIILFLLSPPT